MRFSSEMGHELDEAQVQQPHAASGPKHIKPIANGKSLYEPETTTKSPLPSASAGRLDPPTGSSPAAHQEQGPYSQKQPLYPSQSHMKGFEDSMGIHDTQKLDNSNSDQMVNGSNTAPFKIDAYTRENNGWEDFGHEEVSTRDGSKADGKGQIRSERGNSIDQGSGQHDLQESHILPIDSAVSELMRTTNGNHNPPELQDESFEKLNGTLSGEARSSMSSILKDTSFLEGTNGTADVAKRGEEVSDQWQPNTFSEINGTGHQVDDQPNTAGKAMLEPSTVEKSSPAASTPLSFERDRSTAYSKDRLLSTEASTRRSQSTIPANKPTPRRGRPRKLGEYSQDISGSKSYKARPKGSIPNDISSQEYGRQCVIAAHSSRLNPFALHTDEYRLLRQHINYHQVTTYLNIRNGILRLWMRNPLLSVTKEEALSCAKDSKYFDLAHLAYQWLYRKGYINFGCVRAPHDLGQVRSARSSRRDHGKRRTVVVIGAGMAGLGCARHLEGLLRYYSDHWTYNDELPPKVIVLEGRKRIGGRVYSHPLESKPSGDFPSHLRSTAEMGAHIITGFDNGNPLNVVIRGQLALPHHSLKDNLILYDSDGRVVDRSRDVLVEKLFNDILDRTSVYRHKLRLNETAEGQRDLIEIGRDPSGEGGKTVAVIEDTAGKESERDLEQFQQMNGQFEKAPTGVDKLTGKAFTALRSTEKGRTAAAEAANDMGWTVRQGIEEKSSVDLHEIVNSTECPSLGAAMDEAVRQYQDLAELNAQDMRLVNWHFANLEYANAANVCNLSLGGWDQDVGNEFEGEHAQIIGGYQEVARALCEEPDLLDVRRNSVVERITYSKEGVDAAPSRIECSNGEVFTADALVSTLPLGVLKDEVVQFEPALPYDKRQSIDRLGFGVLNKVVLVYDEVFWDEERDMFGILQDSSHPGSLDQSDYTAVRGRFYFFWNCLKTCGQPVLVGLMAGDAAHQTENSTDEELIGEASDILRKLYRHENVPPPTESIVTRWGKDRFARGTYSYVGVQAKAEDYDTMAKPVGNLFFAGEATCGSHPATVHGAYLSGLRAAAEVVDCLVGPLAVPETLVSSKNPVQTSPPSTDLKRKAGGVVNEQLREMQEARQNAYEVELRMAMYAKIGERPTRPERNGANPFLLYQKDHWYECKKKCDDGRREALGDPEAKASRNEVRAALGRMWREAADEERRPYLEQTETNKEHNATSVADFKKRADEWERAASGFRREYEKQHPSRATEEESQLQSSLAEGDLASFPDTSLRSRRMRRLNRHDVFELDKLPL